MAEISIIVPVYNVEPFLRRCVDSILAQTFTDFELILVDDGSTDNSGAICDEYSEKDARIRAIHKQNGGVSSARNVGIDAANGKYLLFCDGDDFVAPNWAEILVDCITENPGCFIACRYKTVTKNEELEPAMDVDSGYSRVTYYDLFNKGVSAFSCNKIYNKGVIDRIGSRFDEAVGFSEDVEFNVKYCKECSDCILIEAELYYYFQRDNSATGRYREDLLTALFLPFECRIPLISESDLKAYCSAWFFRFYHTLENVFDKRNKDMSFAEKMRYNQQAVSSEQFQFCVEHADLSRENKLFIKLIRGKRYYLLWAIQRLAGKIPAALNN